VWHGLGRGRGGMVAEVLGAVRVRKFAQVVNGGF
jgi:hypothetical protein